MRIWFKQLFLGVAFLSLPAWGQTVHRVKEGESLWLIAKRAGVSVEAIRKANALKNDVIWEGSDLIIPARQSVPNPVPTPTPTPTPPAPAPPLPPRPTPVPKMAPEVMPPPKVATQIARVSKPSAGLTEKGMQILQQQVTLDRAGYSPGVIDGYEGRYTRLAQTLCENWNPQALRANLPATTSFQITGAWKSYVDTVCPAAAALPISRL